MLMWNKIKLEELLGWPEGSYNILCNKDMNTVFSRPIEFWAKDMQNTFDKDGMENTQVFLLCAHRLIYAEDGRYLVDWDGDDYTDYSNHNSVHSKYKKCVCSLQMLYDECMTLQYAEGQQSAFEIQEKQNIKNSALAYRRNDPPDDFFIKLIELREKFFGSCKNENGTNPLSEYKEFWNKCRIQPITLAILPTLFTILLVDGFSSKNIYPYMKYKQRHLTLQNERTVVELYGEICRLIKEYFSKSYNKAYFEKELPQNIPIFSWRKIQQKFIADHINFSKLSDDQKHILSTCLSNLWMKNDLSRKEVQHLKKFVNAETIRALRALGKLCNLNVQLSMQDRNNLSFDHVPSRVKSAYKELIEGHIFTKMQPPSSVAQNVFDYYFKELYHVIPCNPNFSYLALLRYFHLPIYSIFYQESHGLKQLINLMEKVTYQYFETISSSFKEESRIVFHTGLSSNGKDESTQIRRIVEERVTYNYEDSSMRLEHLKSAKLLSVDITRNFSESDYTDFIQSRNNFKVEHFIFWLERFCGKYGLTRFTNASPREACYMVEDAFSTIMSIVQSYLMRNFVHFWQGKVEEILYEPIKSARKEERK